MHTNIGIRPSVSSLATNIQGWIRPLATQIQQWTTSSPKKAKKAMVFDLPAKRIQDILPAVAVLAGAVAFGFWWNSINAGVFACFTLFFLAGIHNALRQILATLRPERDRMIAANSNANTFNIAERSQQNLEASARAIEHLRPWVEDQTSLTEESAKACCTILLDTLATLHPKSAK